MNTKLSKMQVNALASKIVNDKIIENRAYNNTLKDLPEYQNFEETLQDDPIYHKLKRIVASVEELPQSVQDAHRYSLNNVKGVVESYVSHRRGEAFPTRPTNYTYTNVENMIIIETIGASDIDQLINTIKSKL